MRRNKKDLTPFMLLVLLVFAAPATAKTWYVRAVAPAGGHGTRRAPFDTLASVQSASRPGDRIVVLASPLGAAPLGGGIVLQSRQTLAGIDPGHSRIANTGGDAVTLASGATVENLGIGPARRGGIYGRDITRATIEGNDVSATNTSCTTGFVVQPFKLPALVPGVGVPFSGGLPNGWAGIMVDADRGTATLRIAGNFVHDAGCADGIDVRASGTASVAARVTGNVVTRLKEGTSKQSVLAIGMQTTGTAALDARLRDNTETYIGSALAGDVGIADSEGLFANAAGRSHLTERVTANTFAHGLGHLSANCFEVVSSSGGPRMDVAFTNSTCDRVVGDILEAVNLSRDATMNFTADHIRATHSEFPIGPEFHQVEPGDDGVCLFELAAGAHSSTSVTLTNSVLSGCVTDGLEAAASVDDGTGPVDHLSFDVRDSRITGNTLSNVRIANSSPVTDLEGRIQGSDLRSAGTPIILENLDVTGATRAHLDFGNGNCIAGGSALDVLSVRHSFSARGDWWGRAGGPAPGRVVAVGGSVDTGAALAAPPPGTC